MGSSQFQQKRWATYRCLFVLLRVRGVASTKDNQLQTSSSHTTTFKKQENCLEPTPRKNCVTLIDFRKYLFLSIKKNSRCMMSCVVLLTFSFVGVWDQFSLCRSTILMEQSDNSQGFSLSPVTRLIQRYEILASHISNLCNLVVLFISCVLKLRYFVIKLELAIKLDALTLTLNICSTGCFMFSIF